MITKRHLVIAVLCTFCLTFTLFAILPAGSNYNTSSMGEYDPWLDLNDDGKINILECITLAGAFGTIGENVSKTELLYNVSDTFTELLARIDGLNSTLSSRISNLENQIGTMSATIAGMNATITQLQNSNADLNNRVNALESNYSTLLSRIDALEEKAAHPISFNQTRSTYAATATSAWTDVVNLGVSITLEENSTLLIMFSAEAYNYIDAWSSGTIYVRALVDGNVSTPYEITLTPQIGSTGWDWLPTHSHQLGLGSYSYNSYAVAIAPGVHTVKMQFRVSSGTGVFNDSTLTVIALPT